MIFRCCGPEVLPEVGGWRLLVSAVSIETPLTEAQVEVVSFYHLVRVELRIRSLSVFFLQWTL